MPAGRSPSGTSGGYFQTRLKLTAPGKPLLDHGLVNLVIAMSSPSKRKRSSSIEDLWNTHQEGLDHGFLDFSQESVHRHKKQKGQALRIEIPVALNSRLLNNEGKTGSPDSISSPFSAYYSDSLFSSNGILEEDEISLSATRAAPPIPGLFFEPSLLLPQELADSVSSYCLDTYFKSPGINQIMLFTRFLSPPSSAVELSPTVNSNVGLPKILLGLLETISTLLKPVLPPQTYTLLFPTNPSRARQAIINLYQPGEGITPHVDLLGRYGDGIIGVSFSSSCVMRFDRAEEPGTQNDKVIEGFQDKRTRWDLYLPERSILVLSQEARYAWTHGIDKKKRDFVSLPTDTSDQPTARSDTNFPNRSPSSLCASDGTWIDRGTRLSITFRWLLQGADVVGNDVS